MTLELFIEKYDLPGKIVLLLGKRNVLAEDEEKVIELGSKLTQATKHILFRSGNAAGTDELFVKGVSKIASERIQLITPYSEHRKKASSTFYSIPLDALDVVNEPELLYHSKQDKKNKNLIERYEQGFKDANAMKGAYLLRDTLMVVGAKGVHVKRADFAIFYDDLSSPKKGGTGHTMNVCDSLGIPYITQKTWMDWLIK